MPKKFQRSRITKDIDTLSLDALQLPLPNSFEDKRRKFQNDLKKYYKDIEHSSEDLVFRLNEISLYDKRLKETINSAILSLILSTFLTGIIYLTDFIDEIPSLSSNSLISGGIHVLLLWGIMAAVIWASLKFFSVIFADYQKLSAYQQLYCEQFERDLLEQILQERLGQKAPKTDVKGENNETTI